MTPPRSPNLGGQLQAAVRKAKLPLAEKALLRELALSWHPDAGGKGVGGSAPSKAKLMAGMGSDVHDGLYWSINEKLRTQGLISPEFRTDPKTGRPMTTLYTLNLAAIEQLAGDSGKPTALGAAEPQPKGEK